VGHTGGEDRIAHDPELWLTLSASKRRVEEGVAAPLMKTVAQFLSEAMVRSTIQRLGARHPTAPQLT
jgi:hypothetical protein